MISSSPPCGLCAGVMAWKAWVLVDQQAVERKRCVIRFTSESGLSLYSETSPSVLRILLNASWQLVTANQWENKGLVGNVVLWGSLDLTHTYVLLCGGNVETYLLFPVQVLFCRSVWCGRPRSRGQDRDWALPHMFYSNTRSGSLAFRSSHSSLFLRPSLHSAVVHLPLPPLILSQAPPSFLSSSHAPLPPPSSSCDSSTPCSRNWSPASQENGVQLGVPADRRRAGGLPEVWAMRMGLWMLPQTSVRDSRSYLAELARLLKELVVKNE